MDRGGRGKGGAPIGNGHSALEKGAAARAKARAVVSRFHDAGRMGRVFARTWLCLIMG